MQFVCRLGTPDGRVLTQIEDGRDVGVLRRELERQGFHIFDIKPRGFGLPSLKGRGTKHHKLNAEDFLAFNQELAALLRAGLPLMQSLDLKLERMEDENFRSLLTEIRDKVRSGYELSEAFASFGDLFPPLYAATLKAGERSGELEQVLRRFIRFQRLVLSTHKRVVSALVYPVVLILLSAVMMTVMAVVVVPRFSLFYADLGAELPALTQLVLGISFFMRDNLHWFALAIGGSVFAWKRWVRTDAGRTTVDGWKLRIPLVGQIFLQFSLAEFCRSLATLLAGGIPLLQGLETAGEAVSNVFVRKRVMPAADAVRQGGAFYDALDKTGIVPPMAIDMIKVGEATGSLDEMLQSVADHFDEKVEVRTQRLLSLVEPIMMIVMGVLIAILLVSIYLPMFSVLSKVGG
jgi:type IV pilus assembly protein PilC